MMGLCKPLIPIALFVWALLNLVVAGILVLGALPTDNPSTILTLLVNAAVVAAIAVFALFAELADAYEDEDEEDEVSKPAVQHTFLHHFFHEEVPELAPDDAYPGTDPVAETPAQPAGEAARAEEGVVEENK